MIKLANILSEIRVNAPNKNIYIKSKDEYNYIDKDTLEGYLEHVIDEDYLDELRKYMQFENGFWMSENHFFSDNTIPVIKGKSVEQITNKDVETFFKGEVSWYMFGNGYSFPYKNKAVQEIKVVNPNLIKSTWYEEDGFDDIHFGFNINGYDYYAHIDVSEPDEVTVIIDKAAHSGANEYDNLIKYLDKRNIKYIEDEDTEEEVHYIDLNKNNFNIIK